MKIAVLSDIHGNYSALDVVLKEEKELGVTRLFVLGDLVGYYYHPDKVITLLNEWPLDIIQGNHEGFLKRAVKDAEFLHQIHRKYGSGINMAIKKLTALQIKELTELPWKKIIRIDDLNIVLSHGSPWERDYYVYPDSDRCILERCCALEADYIFLGHTHYPFLFHNDRCTIINVGSVGQARDRGGIASWAFFDTADRKIELKTTQYDTTPLVNEVKRIDPHVPYLYQVLLR